MCAIKRPQIELATCYIKKLDSLVHENPVKVSVLWDGATLLSGNAIKQHLREGSLSLTAFRCVYSSSQFAFSNWKALDAFFYNILLLFYMFLLILLGNMQDKHNILQFKLFGKKKECKGKEFSSIWMWICVLPHLLVAPIIQQILLDEGAGLQPALALWPYDSKWSKKTDFTNDPLIVILVTFIMGWYKHVLLLATDLNEAESLKSLQFILCFFFQ